MPYRHSERTAEPPRRRKRSIVWLYFTLPKTGAGSLFGLVVGTAGNGVYYVDDGENTLNLLQ